MNTIEQWLAEQGLSKYAQLFAESAIDFDVLSELSEEDLKELGLALGERKRLLKAIAARESQAVEVEGGAPGAQPGDAEHRQLTVMFCDLVGSTALSEQLDLEEYRKVLALYQSAASEAIRTYEGYIARYMGDGMLVYFGYPQAHEDDAERALHAGLGILESVQALTPCPGVALQVRIGVATGLVVAGDIVGEGASEERAVLGETPNLAARLQALAAVDTMVISSETRQLAAELFEYQDLGRHELKGFKDPVPAWRVLAAKSHDSRFEAARGGVSTPLVGRGRELDLLGERWEWAKAGEGQVVSLSGEPGIGKSRILQALLERVAPEPHVRLRYQCSPHFTNSALYPIAMQLERAARIEREDPVETKLAKLRASLVEVETPLEEATALLAAVMSIATEGHLAPLQMTPERQRERTQEVLLEQLRGLAAQTTVLVVFEDAHWSDPTTLENLQQLIDVMQSFRLLLVLTYRPEFQPPWPSYDHVTALTLSRLTRAQCSAIVHALTAHKALPETVIERMLETTDGVPLFVEEMTKVVLESASESAETGQSGRAGFAESVSIPATLRDSLMARLDRLGEAKEVAQTGAAIGREFGFELHSAVSSLREDRVHAALKKIVQSELVFQRGKPPRSSYVFKHSLVQEVAYAAMLHEKRRKLHGAIASVLEAKFKSEVEAHPEVLARHYAEAGEVQKAIECYALAGQQAASHSANLEAIGHVERALALLSGLPEGSERDERELGLLTQLAGSLIASSGYTKPELDIALTRAMALATQAGNPMPLFPILHGRYLFLSVSGQTLKAYELAKELHDLAEQHAPTMALMISHRIMGNSMFLLGEFEKARQHLDSALALYDSEEHAPLAIKLGQDVQVAARAVLALTLWHMGYAEDALAMERSAIEQAEQMKHANSLSYALAHGALLQGLCRDYELQKQRSELLFKIASENELPVWKAASVFVRGWAVAGLGDLEEGIGQMQQAATLLGNAGVNYWRPVILSELARCLARAGDTDGALEKIEEGRLVVERGGEVWYDAERLRAEAEVLMTQGDASDQHLDARLHQALEVAREGGSKSFELRVATSLARYWQVLERDVEARDLLTPIYNALREQGATPDIQDAKALLDQLHN